MAAERILVVDDDEENREIVQELLQHEGYDVATAADGFTGLQLLEQHPVHVLLSDLKMPGMNGVDLIRRVKEFSPSTIGIIFTGYATIETAVDAIKAGAYDYINKPFQPDELRVVLKRALEYQRLNLFYRLNVIPIMLPPLRERQSDIPLLTAYFIERFNVEKKRHIEGVAPEALERLYNYHWPGNVRELENVIERITILKGEGMIMINDLPEKLCRTFSNGMVPNVDVPDEGLDFDTVVQSFEKQLLTKALEKTQRVKSKAAELLHMNRTTLVEKVKKLRLEA